MSKPPACPNVTFQVIEYDAGAHPGLDSNFVILAFNKAMVNDVIYVEGAVGNIYLESAAELERYKRAQKVRLPWSRGSHPTRMARVLARSATCKDEEVGKEMDVAVNGRVTLGEAERAGLPWIKAPASTHNGACVEVASVAGKIAMRDSKDPDGPILVYTPAEFSTFLNGTRNGEFDDWLYQPTPRGAHPSIKEDKL